MHHVFISYSSRDSEIARRLHAKLTTIGMMPFLAEVDLAGGATWKCEIIDRLRGADSVFFLATPNSCRSQAVAHEIGACIALDKRFVPLLCGVKPADLPEWVDDKQAIDLQDTRQLTRVLSGISERIEKEKFLMALIAVGLIAIVVMALVNDRRA
ncbi:MAG: hypothetical protein C0502_01260 [Opitutus sp.]|nr:hypothetical protein [Opitutus sp.]